MKLSNYKAVHAINKRFCINLLQAMQIMHFHKQAANQAVETILQ